MTDPPTRPSRTPASQPRRFTRQLCSYPYLPIANICGIISIAIVTRLPSQDWMEDPPLALALRCVQPNQGHAVHSAGEASHAAYPYDAASTECRCFPGRFGCVVGSAPPCLRRHPALYGPRPGTTCYDPVRSVNAAGESSAWAQNVSATAPPQQPGIGHTS